MKENDCSSDQTSESASQFHVHYKPVRDLCAEALRDEHLQHNLRSAPQQQKRTQYSCDLLSGSLSQPALRKKGSFANQQNSVRSYTPTVSQENATTSIRPPVDFNNIVLSLPPQKINDRLDLKLLCRLIATHTQRPAVNSQVKLYVEQKHCYFHVKQAINLQRNICCLVFRPSPQSQLPSENLGPYFPHYFLSPSHLIIAFNWFSPHNIWDYLFLGLKLLSRPSSIDQTYGYCSDFSTQYAEQFIHHELMSGILTEIGIDVRKLKSLSNHDNMMPNLYLDTTAEGDIMIKNVSKMTLESSASELQDIPSGSHISHITVTGFSMGANIAHAFAFLLKEVFKVKQTVRCVGYGSPRPGNDEFTKWFHENLSSDSMNIILATTPQKSVDIHRSNNPDLWIAGSTNNYRSMCIPRNRLIMDPITCNPQFEQGFDMHPNIHFLFQEYSGFIFPTTREDLEPLKLIQTEQFTRPKTTVVSSVYNMITHQSPFPAQTDQEMNQLHSVYKYYEAMS